MNNIGNFKSLTHSSQMDFSILINLVSHFPILGVLGGSFYRNVNGYGFASYIINRGSNTSDNFI